MTTTGGRSKLPKYGTRFPATALTGYQCAPLRELRVLTWNIWFDQKYQRERTGSLLQTIEKENPDILCLQEVTPKVLQTICEHPWVRKHCYVSVRQPHLAAPSSSAALSSVQDCQGYTVEPYGTTIFSRIPLHSLMQQSLPSKQVH